MRIVQSGLPVLAGALGLALASVGCSVGQGKGNVHSLDLFARDCWEYAPVEGTQAYGDCYDLQPTFFAANPYYNTLEIRIQRTSDIEEFSDGLVVNINDIATIRSAIQADAGITAGGPDIMEMSDGGAIERPQSSCPGDRSTVAADMGSCAAVQPPPGAAVFQVDLPVGVRPPGSPSTLPPDEAANPAIVHMALYLQYTCHNENSVLYSLDGWIAFQALFDGDPNEASAVDKRTTATFNVEIGDIADVPVGDYADQVPPGLRSHLCGSFDFWFERGQPAQPFP